MTWVKLDDGFYRHPKARAVGKDGRALFLASLCYAAANLTDGFIPASAVPLLAAEAEVRASVATRLVDAGLWELADNGYRAHDYLHRNPTKEKVLAQREAKARAGRRGAEARWQNDDNTDDTVPLSSQASGMDSDMPPSPSRPPRVKSSSSLTVVGSLEDDRLSVVWELIAKLKLKDAAHVKNPVKWLPVVAEEAEDLYMTRAKDLCADYDQHELPADHLAEVLLERRSVRYLQRRDAS